MVHCPHLLWWRGNHCPFRNVVFAECIATCRVRSLLALSRAEASRSLVTVDAASPTIEEVNWLTITQDVLDDGPDAANGAPKANNLDGYLAHALQRMWGMSKLRPNQATVINKIIFDEKCRGKLLLIERTGARKNHAMRMVATMAGGVALVVVPLLSLTANLIKGLKEGSSKDASVETHDIDELTKHFIWDTLVPRLDGISGDSSSLIFLLCSPQELVTNGLFRAAVLCCHTRGVL